MRRHLSNKISPVARWFVLIGVLSGIFFSSGEGLRLLPFPFTTENNQTRSSFENPKNLNSYNLSVHNFSRTLLELKSKLQKETKDSFIIGNSDYRWSIFAKNFQFQTNANFAENKSFYLSTFLISPSGRAPPAI